VTGRQRRRRKQLLDDFEETRGYWKLKGESLDRIVWRTCFARGYVPVVRQTTEWIHIQNCVSKSLFPWVNIKVGRI